MASVLFSGCVRHVPPPASAEHLEGISLQCWNDSVSKYSVEGSNLNNPAFGTKRTSIETHFAEPATSSHWAPRARIHIDSVSGPAPRTGREVRSALRPLRLGLRACHERSQSFDRASRYRLRVRLRWTSPHSVAVAIADERGPGVSADVWNCLSETLSMAQWPVRSTGSQVDFALHLSAQ